VFLLLLCRGGFADNEKGWEEMDRRYGFDREGIMLEKEPG